MRNALCHWTTLMLCVAVAACGRQRETRHPTSETLTDKEALGDASEGAAEADGESQSAEPSKAEPKTKATSRGMAEICEKLNQRATQKCTKQVAGLYQSSCSHYLREPGLCESEIRLALECQYKATDEVLCAHEANQDCSQLNRELKACQRGAAPAEQTTTEDLTLPSGCLFSQGSTSGTIPWADVGDELRMWHCLGDPTLEIWTKFPYHFILPSVIAATLNEASLTLTYEAAGATITALQSNGNGGLIPVARGVLGADGTAEIPYFRRPAPGIPIQYVANLPDSVTNSITQ